jgi:hypothetical protein
MYDLRPGDILLFKKKDGFDPVGSFITAQERDTNTCHAAMIGKTGNIWTTGAIKHLRMPYLLWFSLTGDLSSGS